MTTSFSQVQEADGEGEEERGWGINEERVDSAAAVKVETETSSSLITSLFTNVSDGAQNEDQSSRVHWASRHRK